jgi:enamine deaminase RidA (YjgF/YER057c/UK114 family)
MAVVGGTLEGIVLVTTCFTDRDLLSAIQQVRNPCFDVETAPASTCVMVVRLGHPDFRVEFTPVAVIPLKRFQPPS